MKTPQQIVDAWNEKHPAGTLVKYRETLDGPVTITARTVYPAMLMTGGPTPATWLVGHLWLYPLGHCEPVGGEQ